MQVVYQLPHGLIVNLIHKRNSQGSLWLPLHTQFSTLIPCFKQGYELTNVCLFHAGYLS